MPPWILFVITNFIVMMPIVMFVWNLVSFRVATRKESLLNRARDEGVSVCIPARNEAKSIRTTLEHLLASDHRNFEVLVLDDHSEDETFDVVRSFSDRSARVISHRSHPLPSEWNGKQHACWQLANLAKHSRILFLDADVRLAPDALTRTLAEQLRSEVPLISGFPKQETGTLAEMVLIPMIHYVLLCYLPIDRMRSSTDPAFAAGCGQLFLAKREEYFVCGGHQAIFSSRHDGIHLPRVFRKHGFPTDIFDGTDIATCRMYHSFHEVVRGLLKNGDEGIARNPLIWIFTFLMLGGTILPIALMLAGWCWGWPNYLFGGFALLAISSWLPRVLGVFWFGQPVVGALLHPVAILGFLTLQWIAFFRSKMGIRTRWRGRA